MKFSRNGNENAPEINFIPLIDVLLVIIIFLTMSTTFIKSSGLEIALPTADAPHSTAQVANEINVSITASGEIVIDNVPVADKNVDTIVAALSAAIPAGTDPAPVVVINADAQATHQKVVDVMQAAQAAGLPHITFAIQMQTR
ncbi:biopolymer transporter ExbD [Betaproteobacteria bacterium]|nr:biopolymer transporter ExbD [Betaproteobacteria bacterium]